MSKVARPKGAVPLLAKDLTVPAARSPSDLAQSVPEDAMLPVAKLEIVDEVPWADELTPYDEAQFALYMRVLSATRSFTPEDEICIRILGIDFSKEPERAQKRLDSHLKRALWLTNEGLHLIFPDKCPNCGSEPAEH
jgi:hypothetical protein